MHGPPTIFEVPYSYVGLVLVWGAGRSEVALETKPLELHDLMPIQKAIMVARLRAIADIIEGAG